MSYRPADDTTGGDTKEILIFNLGRELKARLVRSSMSSKCNFICRIAQAGGMPGYADVKATNPDFIIIGWNGRVPRSVFAFLHEMAANTSTSHIPVLLCVSHLAGEDRELILSAGAIDCIEYPEGDEENMICAQQVLSLIKSSNLIRLLHSRQSPLIDPTTLQRDLTLNLLDLRPHLDKEGKGKLSFVCKQLKRELNTESVLKKFDLEQAGFHYVLRTHCNALTRNERRLCYYLMSGFSATDIATRMGRTLNSINVAFARIRGKAGKRNNAELRAYLLRVSCEAGANGQSRGSASKMMPFQAHEIELRGGPVFSR